MNKEVSKTTRPRRTAKAKKRTGPSGNLKAKHVAKTYRPDSSSTTSSSCTPHFLLRSPTPSLRWRPKPSVKNCFNSMDNMEGSTLSFDTSAAEEIAAHRYDRLKASLHSATLPAVISKGRRVANHKAQKPVMASSKSFPNKPSKQAAGSSCYTSDPVQEKPVPVKRRFWVPTPAEMARIGDKVPKAFVNTSVTGRKTVAIPTDTRIWFNGNVPPVESTASVTRNQLTLVRGRRSLTKRPKKTESLLPYKGPGKKPNKNSPLVATGKFPVKAKTSTTSYQVATGKFPVKAKTSTTSYQVATGKFPVKAKTSTTSYQPSLENISSMLSKTTDPASKTTAEPSRNYRKNSRTMKLKILYKSSRLGLLVKESASSHSLPPLPPPYTPTGPPESKADRKVECGSSCCLFHFRSKPLVIEEGGKLASLPCQVFSNKGFNKTCWYCGWEYNPEMIEHHITKCKAIRGRVHTTAEGRRLRKLVERKMKQNNTTKKNLWF